MGSFSLVGSDTIKFNQTILDSGMGHDEVAKLTFPTELATVKTGKNGNTIYVQNSSGMQTVLELKVIRGTADDAMLQKLVTLYKSSPTLYVLDNVEIVKKLGDGAGHEKADTYVCIGGIPTKQVEATVHVGGDVEQAISTYTWTFAASNRALT